MWNRSLMKKAAGLSCAVDGCLIVIDVSDNLKSSFDCAAVDRNSTGDRKSVLV